MTRFPRHVADSIARTQQRATGYATNPGVFAKPLAPIGRFETLLADNRAAEIHAQQDGSQEKSTGAMAILPRHAENFVDPTRSASSADPPAAPPAFLPG